MKDGTGGNSPAGQASVRSGNRANSAIPASIRASGALMQ